MLSNAQLCWVMQDLSTAGKGMAKVVEGFFYGIFALNSVFDPDGLVVRLLLLQLCHNDCVSECLSLLCVGEAAQGC